MKIAILTDAHANLPALEVALRAIRQEGYDLLIHMGDAIAIGPFPAECLDLLLSTPRATYIMGNHEIYFVNGIPNPQPDWMNQGEVEHQHWTHACLTSQLKETLSAWPYFVSFEVEGVKLAFLHYALTPAGNNFQPLIRNRAMTPADLDQAFLGVDAEVIFYGHNHQYSDLYGRARYYNPGSLGCYPMPQARYCLAEVIKGKCVIEQRQASYNDESLFKAFEQRQVPDRQFIYKAFFGGRFTQA